jgi:SAM-dependent methyltransferase
MKKFNVLRNGFCNAAPSPQSALDIFTGSWWTGMPAGSGLIAGKHPGFEDSRCGWVNDITPLAGKSILELGPFEAYNTWQLANINPRRLVSIEANRFNYLKCLVVKEVLGFKADFLLGDICKYLENTDRFDFIFASGVLYHQTDPLNLLHLASKKTDTIYLWTHYFDEGCLASSQQGPGFRAAHNSQVEFCGEPFEYHYRSYLLDDFDNSLPLNWSGGTASYTNWLTRADVFRALELLGFTNIRVQVDGDRLENLPVIAVLAQR